MLKHHLIITFFLFGVFSVFSSVLAGTILADYKYAWSDRSGYINFSEVIVSDTALSGYAWSANHGWINFNPATGGVTNDGNGVLSGYAWGSGLGWIDFSGVQISTTTGRFSGLATGTVVGTINFDCPNYCDVRTDWRGASSSPVVVRSKSGSVSSSDKPYFETLITTTAYQPGFSGLLETPSLFPPSEGGAETIQGVKKIKEVKTENQITPKAESGESKTLKNYYYFYFVIFPALIWIIFYWWLRRGE